MVAGHGEGVVESGEGGHGGGDVFQGADGGMEVGAWVGFDQDDGGRPGDFEEGGELAEDAGGTGGSRR